jgi:hypothetical protein
VAGDPPDKPLSLPLVENHVSSILEAPKIRISTSDREEYQESYFVFYNLSGKPFGYGIILDFSRSFLQGQQR